MVSFFFDDEGRITRTAGPFFGIAAEEADLHLARDGDGVGLLVLAYPGGQRLARCFDAAGIPVASLPHP